MKKVKWGIIGLGKIAAKFASDLLISENSILYGVASRNIEKAKTFATKFNSKKYYGSYFELAQDSEIDAVYIATPHVFHFKNTMMCLQYGKAVLCEKPLGINSDEVKIMIDEARQRKLLLMEGIWTRFIPITEKLLELLNNKIIGDIEFIRADFGFKADSDLEGRVYNKALGGGSLLDIGIYPIYLSLLTLGVPKKIRAIAEMTETNVDKSCSMLFKYDNNISANLESTIAMQTPTEAYIYGNKGIIKIHSRFHHSEKLTIFKENKQIIDEIKYKGYGYLHEIEEFNNCLIKGYTESKKVPLDLSMNLIQTMDTVKKIIGLSYK